MWRGKHPQGSNKDVPFSAYIKCQSHLELILLIIKKKKKLKKTAGEWKCKISSVCWTVTREQK